VGSEFVPVESGFDSVGLWAGSSYLETRFEAEDSEGEETS
jgi:hypothetical protein